MRGDVWMVCLAVVASCASAWADSPITSTPFSEAYRDVPEVVRAAESGVLTRDLAAYLLDEETPLDRAAAVINALSWSLDGKDNAERLLQFLPGLSAGLDQALRRDDPPARLLFVLGYLEAMDNYFEAASAEETLRIAAHKLPNSFTAAFIHALVAAQDAEWCDAFEITQGVVDRFPGHRDMRERAVEIVMDYMILYAEYCVEEGGEPNEPDAGEPEAAEPEPPAG